jgi:hypothetical protein
MISLELPHINILTKCDLMEPEEVERVLDYGSASQLWDVDQDRHSLYDFHQPGDNVFNDPNSDGDATSTAAEKAEVQARMRRLEARRRGRHRLTDAICQLLDDYSMVSFLPLNMLEEESVEHVLATVDHAIQYGEDLEVRGADDSDEQEVEEENDDNDE